MKDMTIIITMAGNGKRFRDSGYDKPKYMIEAKGKTLFEWSMESLKGYSEFTEKYFFVVKKEDDARSFIIDKCTSLNIQNIEIIELSGITDGQATTAFAAALKCNSTAPILIYNIDTYVEAGEMKMEDIEGDGHIPCFRGKGDHWSFVKLGSDGFATEVREKQRISEFCTVGAYYFSSAGMFIKFYNRYYSENNVDKNNKEKYISPLYNYMIQEGMKVSVSIISNEKVHVLGTPRELNEFIYGI